MCKFCKKPNKTIVALTDVQAFVGAGCLWLRFYDNEHNKTIFNTKAINYCPMCGRKLTEEK